MLAVGFGVLTGGFLMGRFMGISWLVVTIMVLVFWCTPPLIRYVIWIVWIGMVGATLNKWKIVSSDG